MSLLNYQFLPSLQTDVESTCLLTLSPVNKAWNENMKYNNILMRICFSSINMQEYSLVRFVSLMYNTEYILKELKTDMEVHLSKLSFLTLTLFWPVSYRLQGMSNAALVLASSTLGQNTSVCNCTNVLCNLWDSDSNVCCVHYFPISH